MPDGISSARRITILIGLAVALLVPLVPLIPGGEELLRIPGLAPIPGREAFFWALGAIVVLYVLIVERRPLSSIGWNGISWKTFAFGAAGAVAVLAFAGAVVVFGLPLLHLVQNGEALKKMAALPYGLRFAIVLRAGIVEELLFRGYGIERLRELTGNKYVAGAITLALFSLAHLSHWGMAQIAVAGAAGLVLTALYLWRRDLATNIVAHFLVDGSQLLLS
jgi:membrane protease YdiL (CAAX protease family)